MKRVEGYNGLYRNEDGAIVNTDSSGYEAYKRKRDKIRAKDSTIDQLGSQLEEAKSQIEELKALVQAALEGKIDK